MLNLRLAEHGNRYRRRRFAHFLEVVDAVAVTGRPLRVLDIGGTLPFWESQRDLWHDHNMDITILNIDADEWDRPPYHSRRGDACALPIKDDAFDVIHSNSVIEHVGGWDRAVAMAREVRRVAPTYFIQTPNFWFPLEAHYRMIGVQFLPPPLRARLLVRAPRGFLPKATDFTSAMDMVQHVDLLDAGQMRILFPDAVIHREKAFGLSKSLTAVRLGKGERVVGSTSAATARPDL